MANRDWSHVKRSSAAAVIDVVFLMRDEGSDFVKLSSAGVNRLRLASPTLHLLVEISSSLLQPRSGTNCKKKEVTLSSLTIVLTVVLRANGIV